MARKLKESRRADPGTETAKISGFRALVDHAKENPQWYLAGAGFVVAVVLVTSLYRVYASVRHQNVSSEFARALEIEDPAERAAALSNIASSNSDLSAEALYLAGESHFTARDYDAARRAFTRLRETYPDFDFTPDAVEGLGYIAETEEDYDSALEYYTEVVETWPGTFAGRRQPLNLGRVYEKQGNLESAVSAYQDQLTAFPGSNVAQDAQRRLTDLRATHPELFPEPEEPELDIEALDLEEAPDFLERPGDVEAPVLEVPSPTDPNPAETTTRDELEEAIPDEAVETDAPPGENEEEAGTAGPANSSAPT